MKNKIKEITKTTKFKVTISFIIFLIGLLLISYNYLCQKKDKTYERIDVKTFIQSEEPVETKEVKEEKQVKKTKYLAVLEIPKINLKRGFYSKTSKKNNVDSNIMILPDSTYPDEDNGNVILAAHSGSSYVGFFKNLYKLKLDDKATITYKGQTYNYTITDIYNVKKTGSVKIYRDNNKNCLTLITCTKNSETKQTVYIFELESQEEI